MKKTVECNATPNIIAVRDLNTILLGWAINYDITDKLVHTDQHGQLYLTKSFKECEQLQKSGNFIFNSGITNTTINPIILLKTDINKNIQIPEELLEFGQRHAEYHIKEALKYLFINVEDSNVKDTPKRIVKMWSKGREGDELLSGRFDPYPDIKVFESTSTDIVSIKMELNAVCSHHFTRFGTVTGDRDSYCLVAYQPEGFVLGLSKIGRLVNWISRRGWLQEDLTKAIFDEISKVTKSDNVFVRLSNLQHGCMSFRGYNDGNALTTTEKYSGIFVNSIIRKEYI